MYRHWNSYPLNQFMKDYGVAEPDFLDNFTNEELERIFGKP